MGRLELKLLALRVLLTGVPLGVAYWLSGTLFDRSLGAGINPAIEQALEDASLVYGDYVRAEKARQRAIATGLADSRALANAASRGPDAIRAPLAPYAAAPRVIEISVDEVRVEGPPKTGDWLRAEVVLDTPEGHTVRYTYGLERAVLERFQRMESEVIEPFRALASARDDLADEYAWNFVGALAAALFVAGLVSVVTGRRVTQRLERLHQALTAVGEGATDVRLIPEGRDEVADLARGFNQMARTLGETTARVQYLSQVSAWQGIARRLAHEIKNPLTPILLSAQQAQQSYRGDDDRYRRTLDTAVEVIEEEVRNLRRLVDNFSRFARLPAVAPEPGDLAALVNDVVAGHPEIAHIEARAAADEIPADFDRGLLRQALTNLVKNGAEAATEAGREPLVTIDVEVLPDGHRLIAVGDNGPGVPPEDRARVFDPYVTGKADGTGLGLAIVKKIVLDHGGSLEVTDAEGGGARFELRLPAPG